MWAKVELAASPAFAHPNHDPLHDGGLVAGLIHPLLGLDHLLAMVAVGLVGARLGGRAKWAVPGAFLASLIGGGTYGVLGYPLPGVEYGIAGSLVVLGAAIAWRDKLSLSVPLACAIVFGFFHGHAHGAETPSLASPAIYAAGFVVATACLHVAGVFAGRWALTSTKGVVLLRMFGGAVATVGLILAVAIMAP